MDDGLQMLEQIRRVVELATYFLKTCTTFGSSIINGIAVHVSGETGVRPYNTRRVTFLYKCKRAWLRTIFRIMLVVTRNLFLNLIYSIAFLNSTVKHRDFGSTNTVKFDTTVYCGFCEYCPSLHFSTYKFYD